MAYQVNGSRVEWNPTAARLRELTEEMPNATLTEFGNVAVKARVDSRSTRSTYIVDDSTNSRGQTITRAEYDRVTAIQDAHIAKSHMVVVDGYLGIRTAVLPRGTADYGGGQADVARACWSSHEVPGVRSRHTGRSAAADTTPAPRR